MQYRQPLKALIHRTRELSYRFDSFFCRYHQYYNEGVQSVANKIGEIMKSDDKVADEVTIIEQG